MNALTRMRKLLAICMCQSVKNLECGTTVHSSLLVCTCSNLKSSWQWIACNLAKWVSAFVNNAVTWMRKLLAICMCQSVKNLECGTTVHSSLWCVHVPISSPLDSESLVTWQGEWVHLSWMLWQECASFLSFACVNLLRILSAGPLWYVTCSYLKFVYQGSEC
jgi:hypothetical protein